MVRGTWYLVLNQRGVSLIELLIVTILAAMIMLATAVPFFTEKSFLVQGERQAEAQRDAQVVTHAVELAGRQSTGFTLATPAANHQRLTFTQPCGNIIFDGGAGFNGGQFRRNNQCTGQTDILVDAVRSRVANFAATQVTANLVNLQINVIHDNQRNEVINTQIHLRNA